jgi:hypothetical protein
MAHKNIQLKKDLTKVRLYDSYASFYDYSWLFNYWFSFVKYENTSNILEKSQKT